MIKTQKVYELTTNKKDGFVKWYVRGIKNDAQGKRVALKGFGKEYYSKLITHYDDYPSKYGNDWRKRSLTINQFIKQAGIVYHVDSQ